ncbi:neural-cadherin-like isoform X3 [Apostichopus japonicus]|uniref:neural-cadherin-like isoform X3 n=1 Tax=Stichopus japonicus TaxID=307972 RepID=UPI003AB4EB91
MATCRTALAILVLCVLFILPVVFSLAISSISVPYDAPLGYDIATIETDGETVRLKHVDDASKVFRLSKEGKLSLKYPLQTLLHKGRTAVVVVVQHGHGFGEWEELINVHISGVNSKLHFTESSCIARVTENSPIGTPLEGLENLSVWRGDAQVLQVQLTGLGSEIFTTEVSSDDGQIRMFTNSILDREEIQSYDLRLFITGDGPNPETAEAEIHVDVGDENDNPPEFFQLENVFSIALSSPVGTEAGSIHAVDRDSGDNGDVTYFLIMESPFFDVDSKTGVISVMAPIGEAGEFNLFLFAQDDGNPSLTSESAAQVKIIVKPLSPDFVPYGNDMLYPADQIMEFKQARSKRDLRMVSIDVEENSLADTIIGTVTDYPRDTDEFSTNSTLFAVDQFTGNITLKMALNFEQESRYTFIVQIENVSDTESVEKVEVSVSVLDVSDPPFWTNTILPFIAVVPSDAPQNAPVYQLMADDEDGNALLRFYIRTGEGFYIDEETGEIKTEPGFVYSSDDAPYILSVYVEDINSVSEDDALRLVNGQVDIFVDSHPPQFTEDPYQVMVSEDVPTQDVLTVQAISFTNERLEYSLLQAPPGTPDHVIDAETGAITLQERVDREILDRYFLEVKATEQRGDRLSSIVRIDVKVEDTNDNDPEFDQAAYSFDNITETIGMDEVIGSVKAIDLDEGKNGMVSYTLSGDDASYFRVDSDGNLFADEELDFDLRSETYFFFVMASDGASVPRSTRASVRVRVTPEDDEFPVFAPSSYTYYVDEIAGEDYSIGTVYASDADLHVITFSMETDAGGRFKVEMSTDSNHKGVIKLTAVGDKNLPEAEYDVVVAATDEIGLKSTANVKIVVNDVNDNAPVFTNCSTYRPTVSEVLDEDATEDPVVLQVSATDADRGSNAELTYRLLWEGTGENPFVMDAETGVITLTFAPDREMNPSYQVTALARDKARDPSVGLCTFTILVEDVNDARPRFRRNQYEATIPVTHPVGQEVVTVEAVDPDLNSEITYSLDSSGIEYFRMIPATGMVIVRQDLSPLADQTWTGTIRASDGKHQTTETLTVRIVDSTDAAPMFRPFDEVITIPENFSTNALENVIGEYSAVFPEDVADDRITYSLLRGARPGTNFPAKFVLLNDESFTKATIIVSADLDFETVEEIDLTIVAEGVVGSFPAQANVKIILLDVNDNPPRFPLVDFDATVQEHSVIGTSVATVVAEDADSTPQFREMRYSIDQPPENVDWQNFAIDPTTGEITTTFEFDREITKTYLINVIAQNVEPLAGGTTLPNRAQTSVRIDILDINDNPPTFESESYTVSVSENLPIGFVVTQVTASDLDIDSTLRYFITNGNTNGVFEVDADSGEISIAVGLDFEKVQNYTLEYSANDGLHSAVTIIYMNVIDINDKRPEFDQILYQAEIEEESSVNIPGILLEVNAIDGDTAASPIEYSLDGTGANGIFSINRRTGVITINEVLDREEQASYVLIAIGTDEDGQGLSGYTTVLVTVTDINDNEPRFPQVEYAGSVPEGSPRGTEVMEVIAEDRDDPNTPNGRLMYAIVPDPNDPNDGSDEFAIDSDTGVVTTAVAANELDAETQDTYTIKVTATDGTSTAETVATITIDDVNDNAPVFDPSSYSETIPETLPLGDTAVEVMATDADLKLTHEVSFVIVSGNTDDAFAVYTDTPTLRGLIYPQKVLDFESGQTSYTLEVDVSDGKFTDRATVSITVTDENEPPIFDPSTYSSTVLESIAPGNTIITVMASDPDGVSPNDQFSYSVDPTSDPEGLFTMIGNQLQVADGKELDRETVEVHKLTVLATDEGTPPLSGSATVEVTLTDVDDTAPRFAENYVGYVEENTTRIQWVAVVGAVDDDLTPPDPDFSFFIPSNQPGKNFFAGTNNQGNDSFTIKTNGNVNIDREVNPSFDLVIEISDEGGNTGQNVLPIVVIDKNDNPHHPVTKSMLVYAFEGAVPNIGIGFVGVNDLDILEDKTYTVMSGESQYINVDVDTGLVEIAAGTPATDTGGPYTLDVLVSDGGKYDDVTSTIVITVKEVPREAVFKSGSLRLSGITPEEFITPMGGPSAMEKLLKLLSTITGAKEENIDIFTVLPVPDMENTVDVRYSAHGSPYYSAERLNGDAESKIALIESTLTGVTVEAIYIDECGSAECEADCSNVLTIDPDPVVINSVEASMVGINAFISPFCGCAARDGDVGTCIGHYCHNGGTCEDTFSGPKCKCEEGFTGPDCQGTTRSFGGDDYAILPTLEMCSETRTSVEFITRESSGLILYNGPTSKLGPQDYILLQLRAGKPLLRMDLGAGDLTMEVTNNGALNDGKWHKVDIFRNGLDVELVIDDCASASVFENHTTSVFSNSDLCKASATLPGDETVFHANKPLQLGGVNPNLEYPQTLGLDSVDGFNGCIRNVDQDSTLYDLYDVDEASSGSQPGCPDADKHCDALRPPCINGVCDADFSGAVCICNPGWFGDGCDQELDAYDFLDSSYVTYQLKTNLPLPDRESSYKIMIRTRQQTGRVWQITNANTFEHVTMQLQDGYLMSSWHLGDNTISVTLDKYPLDNGEWHSIFFYRYDNYIQIKVDGGGGVRQAENRDSSFRVLQVDRDNLVVGAELLYGVTVSSDFVGCMKDPRIGDNYLGVTETSEFASPMAVNVNEGCPTEPCPGSSMCIAPLVCFDIWRAFECRCAMGYTLLDDACVDAQDCSSNPCQNGAKCMDKFDDYECMCPKDFTGKDCDLKSEAVFLTIRAGGIIPIVACLLLLLLLLLLFIVYKRTEDKKNALAFAVDPEDDMRENFINYDEEGGEKDQTAYDITMLRKPVQPSPIVPRPVKTLEDVPQRSIPRDGVNVGDFLEERLGDTDHDPSAPPYDTLHTYDYEGEGSTSGSLSSLNSNSSDGSQDYDYLKGLGPPFKRLADMYGGVE